jgi:hypothetical protein
MVHMRPNFYHGDTVTGEKLVFNKLSSLDSADSWIAMHSLDIFGDIRSGQGEADFVVLIPGKGILVIEVKSHSSVECIEGVWRLNEKVVDKPPHKQASNAMHALRKDLMTTGVDLYKIPTGFCVWFTGARKVKLPPSPEYKQWMYLFSDDLKGDVRKSLLAIMDSWASHRSIPIGSEANGVATRAALSQVAGRLRPDVRIRKTASQRIEEIEDSMSSALEEQLQLMFLISGKKQVAIISGIAGTGKTHIAIAEAKKLHQRGDRTLFICYNSILADYLRRELEDYALVEVNTISKYMLEICGLQFSSEKDQDWWTNQLPAIAQEEIVNLGGLDRFDALIVDEAQDISFRGYLDVLDLSLAKGFTGSSAMFFGDFKYQGVYVPGDMALENLKSRVPAAIEFQPLSINCRNTREIGDTVMQLIGDKSAYSSYRRKEAGIPPTLIPIKEGESTLKHLRGQLSRLEKNFELENIVVLSSNKAKLFELIEKTGLPLTDLSFKQKGKLRWGTSQAFKGMEAPAVLLVEFEDGHAATKETFYVAGTRATAEWVCIMPSKVIKALLQGGN